MGNDNAIAKYTAIHKAAVQTMFRAEHKLEQLWAEKFLSEALYKQLQEQQIDVQVKEENENYQVILTLEQERVIISHGNLSAALLGAQKIAVGV